MKKRRRKSRRRSLQKRSDRIDRSLEGIENDIKMLDLAIDSHFPEHLSSHEEAWAEGCREGMAIAYDRIMDRVLDIAIRAQFKPRPIKMRYYGVVRMIKDDSLLSKPTAPDY